MQNTLQDIDQLRGTAKLDAAYELDHDKRKLLLFITAMCDDWIDELRKPEPIDRRLWEEAMDEEPECVACGGGANICEHCGLGPLPKTNPTPF